MEEHSQNNKRKVVFIRVPRDDAEWLAVEAKARGMSASVLISVLLHDFHEKIKRGEKLTLTF